MNGFVIPLCKLIELQITNANAFVEMPSVEKDLNDAYICNVFVESATQQTYAPSGRVNFAAADIVKCGLVLKDVGGSHARIDNVPLYEFTRSLNSGISSPFKKFRWSPSNSGVQINDPAGLTVGQSILLSISYIPINEMGQEVL